MTKADFAIAVNKFFYFAMNYSFGQVTYQTFDGEKTEYLPTFLNANWHCNKAHMVGKWKAACIKKYDENDYPIFNDSYGTINRFYAELDGKNRMAFLTWVMENYKQDDNYGICLNENETA